MTPLQRSRAMQRVRCKDGSLEMLVRRELTRRGYRYRCHVQKLPGSHDVVFTKQGVAVFVDGDFWHGWRLPTWEHKLSPFWRDKLHANRTRDARNFRRLRSGGWRSLLGLLLIAAQKASWNSELNANSGNEPIIPGWKRSIRLCRSFRRGAGAECDGCGRAFWAGRHESSACIRRSHGCAGSF